jgi:hypothetical protein
MIRGRKLEREFLRRPPKTGISIFSDNSLGLGIACQNFEIRILKAFRGKENAQETNLV